MRMSESITELAKALSNFQGEVNNINPTAVNPFFKSKYAPLEEVLKEVRPKLAEQGLSVIQTPVTQDNKVGVVTLLLHESGEFIQTKELLLVTDKNTAQGAGSAITYARRYALTSILGVAADEDDDGNVAEIKSSEEPINNNGYRSNKNNNNYVITEAQLKRLYAIANKAGVNSQKVQEHVFKRFKKKPEELTKSEYDIVCAGYESKANKGA